MYSFFTHWALLHQEFATKQICRSQLSEIQRIQRTAIKNILQLNPLAWSLHLQKRAQQAKLAACASMVNPCAIQALAEIAKTEQQQQKLAQVQYTFEQFSKVQSEKLILQMITNQTKKQNFWLIKTQFLKIPRPSLAIKKSFEDTASPFELKKDFKNEQALESIWIQNFILSKNLQPWDQKTSHQHLSGCSATLQEDSDLSVTLKKVNLWSKSWSF